MIIISKELPKRVMSQSSQIEVRVEIRWIVPRSAEARPNSLIDVLNILRILKILKILRILKILSASIALIKKSKEVVMEGISSIELANSSILVKYLQRILPTFNT